MCSNGPDGTCSFQRGWSHHPLTAAAPHRARGQGGRVLETGERRTEGDAHFLVKAQVADHRRSVYGVQSEPGLHSPPSGRDICQRQVVWRGEYSVCGRHPATPTCQRNPPCLSITSKLGCMTSVNIWQDSVVYDELTINERQKKDQVFSSMLDEVRRGCPACGLSRRESFPLP